VHGFLEMLMAYLFAYLSTGREVAVEVGGEETTRARATGTTRAGEATMGEGQ